MKITRAVAHWYQYCLKNEKLTKITLLGHDYNVKGSLSLLSYVLCVTRKGSRHMSGFYTRLL